MNIEFRKGVQTDIDTIVNFQIAMALETENLSLDKATVQKGVSRIINSPETGFYLVAISKDEVIASLLILYEWSDWRNGNVLWIHSVYVAASFRRKGVFQKMYEQLKSSVEKDESLKGLRLYVEKKNEVAQKVYTSLGMTKEHYELFEWMQDF